MGREKKKRRLSAAATAEFARSFGTLLAAGLPAAEALRSIAESRGSFAVRQASDRVRAGLKEGYSLSEAVRRSGMFPRAAVAAFRAEPLEGARRLERYCEGQHELGVRLRAAFLQPGILLGVTLLVLLVLLGVVLPGYFELFEREELPGAKAALARMSLFLARDWGWAILVLAGTAALFVLLFRLPVLARHTQRLLLYLPFVGHRLRTVETGRFAQGLQLYCESGLAPKEAFYQSGGSVRNRWLAARVAAVPEEADLVQSVRAVGVFDRQLAGLLGRGEETLPIAAKLCTEEAERAADQLCRTAEPVLCGLSALLMLFVMISILLPAFGLFS